MYRYVQSSLEENSLVRHQDKCSFSHHKRVQDTSETKVIGLIHLGMSVSDDGYILGQHECVAYVVGNGYHCILQQPGSCQWIPRRRRETWGKPHCPQWSSSAHCWLFLLVVNRVAPCWAARTKQGDRIWQGKPQPGPTLSLTHPSPIWSHLEEMESMTIIWIHVYI